MNMEDLKKVEWKVNEDNELLQSSCIMVGLQVVKLFRDIQRITCIRDLGERKEEIKI